MSGGYGEQFKAILFHSVFKLIHRKFKAANRCFNAYFPLAG
jgi:hypothetical protein